MATFVLVHGAFHGGWCWRDVARLLRGRGHEVFTPTLTGLGERAHLATPGVDLDTHIRDVTAVLEWEELSGVVLVGHSYGGMPITGAADRMPERIARLVYLDAVVPWDGFSMLDYQTPERRQSFLDATAAMNGWQYPPRTAAYYGVRDPVRAAWVDAKCTPHPFGTVDQKIVLSAPPGSRVPARTLILCTDPPLPHMRQFYDRASRDPEWETLLMETGHDAMVTEPEALADLLHARAD